MAHIQEEKPDLIVGVDFGMTYTGVAWTNLLNLTQSIDDWPGLGDGQESKVPTKLLYSNPLKWGFLCDDDDEDTLDDVHEMFKIYLDPTAVAEARKNGLREVPSVEQTKHLVTDYLRELYAHVKRSIENSVGRWQDMRVEFVFSMPTTWRTLSVVNDFESAIRAAGFGEENPLKHSAKLELTEAEAAAVYVAGNPQVTFLSGDVLLVCDAGGGTTDLGLLEVIDANPQLPSLKQVNAVKGVGIGSTMIDRAFENMVQNRLNNNPDAQVSLPRNLAGRLARSTAFRAIKHKFGTAGANHPEWKLALDRLGLGIGQDYTHPGLRVERGRMVFSRAEIQSLFDHQIRGIVRRIDEQLAWMTANRPSQSVKYLVLSGGLGGSLYVKSQLEARYNSSAMSIIRSQEPRLSVVKGLVMDRRQKVVSGTATIITRIARASYGVLCRQPYNPQFHIGADVEVDMYKKNQKWAINQIEWLIRKGDTINTSTALEKPFTKKLEPNDPSRTWDTPLFISHNSRLTLPRSLKQAGAQKLCVLKTSLAGASLSEFILKNKRCWQGKKYYLATFTIRVIVAPANLNFELWFRGTRYTRGHEPIAVRWDPAGAEARPSSEDGEKGGEGVESWGNKPLPGR